MAEIRAGRIGTGCWVCEVGGAQCVAIHTHPVFGTCFPPPSQASKPPPPPLPRTSSMPVPAPAAVATAEAQRAPGATASAVSTLLQVVGKDRDDDVGNKEGIRHQPG